MSARASVRRALSAVALVGVVGSTPSQGPAIALPMGGKASTPARPGLEPAARTISWDGYVWTVRKGFGGPGPNHWNPNSVWVDGDGYLHLRIAYHRNRWSCAELQIADRLGFGTYTWVVEQAPMPVHINLWLFDGNPPTDGRQVEVVIRSFTFTPTPG